MGWLSSQSGYWQQRSALGDSPSSAAACAASLWRLDAQPPTVRQAPRRKASKVRRIFSPLPGPTTQGKHAHNKVATGTQTAPTTTSTTGKTIAWTCSHTWACPADKPARSRAPPWATRSHTEGAGGAGVGDSGDSRGAGQVAARASATCGSGG